jgi:hypothetical protein
LETVKIKGLEKQLDHGRPDAGRPFNLINSNFTEEMECHYESSTI